MIENARKYLLLAATVIVLAGTTSDRAHSETWKCYTYIPSPTHAVYTGMVEIMEELKDATGGRIDHKCNVGGSLPIEANSIAPALSDGVLDLATTGFVSGVVPLSGLTFLPGLFGSLDEVETGYEILKPALAEAFDDMGVVLLGHYVYPRQVIWANGDVTELSGLEGKTVRVTTLEQAEFVKAFNGVPVSLATPEVATSLQRGVATVVLTAAAGGGRLWIDLLDHMVQVGPNYSVSFILVSKEKFDALSPEEQQALRESSQRIGASITEKLFVENEKLEKEYAANGLVITPSNPAQEKLLVDTMKGYWDTWADERGEKAKEVLHEVRQQLNK